MKKEDRKKKGNTLQHCLSVCAVSKHGQELCWEFARGGEVRTVARPRYRATLMGRETAEQEAEQSQGNACDLW